MVGLLVGRKLGDIDGLTLGFEGVEVRESVGDIVGVLLGRLVGGAVGGLVGVAVGRFVVVF